MSLPHPFTLTYVFLAIFSDVVTYKKVAQLLCINIVLHFTGDVPYSIQVDILHNSALGIQHEEGFNCVLGPSGNHQLIYLMALHFPRQVDGGVEVPQWITVTSPNLVAQLVLIKLIKSLLDNNCEFKTLQS